MNRLSPVIKILSVTLVDEYSIENDLEHKIDEYLKEIPDEFYDTFYFFELGFVTNHLQEKEILSAILTFNRRVKTLKNGEETTMAPIKPKKQPNKKYLAMAWR